MNTATTGNSGAGLVGRTDVTEAIIGAAYRVANTLGAGFLEKVYENALAIELRRRGHDVEQQKAVDVWYEGEIVGLYQADLIVDSAVVVELKAVASLERIHRAQCLNHLRATRMELGLVINFGRPRMEVQRVVASCSKGLLPATAALPQTSSHSRRTSSRSRSAWGVPSNTIRPCPIT